MVFRDKTPVSKLTDNNNLSDYTYGSMSYEDAYNYCLGVLKGWYEKGLICK